MSQKREKAIRQIDKRVTNLEGRVDKLDDDVIMQAVKIAQMDDELAVYRAAVGARDAKRAENQVAAARAERAEKRRKEAIQRRRARIFILAAAVAVLSLVVGARATVANRMESAKAEEPKQVEVVGLPEMAEIHMTDPLESGKTDPPTLALTPAEDPMEPEKIEAALLEQGYYSEAVPMCYEWQDFMRTYCAAYSVPYSLALAVAETETHFDMEATGAAGEVGIMQLNPGPSGAYHKAIQEITRLDPATPCGNIAAGCYLLGKYLQDYGNTEKALMAYNMGVGGAMSAWEKGITSTEYSRKVIAAAERWECTVIEWQGM